MFQRGDGHFGAYVVRQTASQDVHANLYDYDLTEHVIIAQEWFHSVRGWPGINVMITIFGEFD
jgi:hypothetical protein